MVRAGEDGIERRLLGLGRGDHVCVISEAPREWPAAALPFLAHGLDRGECCLHIADEAGVQEACAALQARGVDVQRERDRGALRALTDRASSPAGLMDALNRAATDAQRAGLAGLRVAADMAWAVGEGGLGRLAEYEAALGRFLAERGARALCLYARPGLPPAALRDALRCHSHAVVGGRLCANPFHEPPDILLSSDEAGRVEWMLRQIQDGEEAASERERAARRKDVFLSTLAHELRSPLAPVRNAATVLKSKVTDDPQVIWCREVIDRQAAQMGVLLEGLLDASRLTQGKLLVRKGPTTLAAVVSRAVEASRPLIEASAHELTVALPLRPVPLDADEARLAQALSHLLDNAAKYTGPGGQIRLSAERQGGGLALTVKDSGIGITAERLAGLFEMFSDEGREEDRVTGGLGVGLALVKGIVGLHGGTVEGRSDGPGKGSEFTVRLPVAAEPARPTSSSNPLILVPGGYRILVADDHRDGADALAMMLRTMGNEVRIAYDGDEAVRTADDFRPDVALLDIGMPLLDGYETARRIRKTPWGKRMMLVAQTGWGQEEDRRRSSEAGFDHHLVKPVDPTALLKLLAGAGVVSKPRG